MVRMQVSTEYIWKGSMCYGVCFHSTLTLPFLVLVKLTGFFLNHPHFIISFIITYVFFCLL